MNFIIQEIPCDCFNGGYCKGISSTCSFPINYIGQLHETRNLKI